ncbi:UNVERIFIED_CONTAM: GluRIA [Trichonephila clavipes]
MNRGIFTLVAPTGEASYDTLASYSNTFQVPFISPAFPELSSDRPAYYGLSLRPRYLRAILDVIIYYNWKIIYYLYDTDGGKFQLACGILLHLFLGKNQFIIWKKNT